MAERPRVRLDQLLLARGLAASRAAAQAAIMAGRVTVDGRPADKAGRLFAEDAAVAMAGPARPYASRGGEKLEGAWRAFGFAIEGRVALDGGASTGGFTDFLLKRGAARVFAVDVGYGQLAWELRQDPRVVVLERQNLRHLTPAQLGGARPELCVLDLSFISLGKVYPALGAVLADDAELVALVKPQFEAGPERVGKGGVVRSSLVHGDVLRDALQAARAAGFRPVGLAPSPLRGPEGNVEFFLRAARGGLLADLPEVSDGAVPAVVERAP